MPPPRYVSLISDVVPTHSDELPNATRLELAFALRNDATVTEVTRSEDVFSEDTIETPLTFSKEPTLR